KGEGRREKGEGRREKGEGRKEKGERRKEKGERRKEKGERRKEKGDKGYLSSAFSLLSSASPTNPCSRPLFQRGPPRKEALIPAPFSKGGAAQRRGDLHREPRIERNEAREE